MKSGCIKQLAALGRRAALYIRALAKWLALAAVAGVLCGVVGAVFHIGVHRVTALRAEHPWLLWCLPLAGLVIVGFYKLTRTEGQGTNDIIDEVHSGRGLSIWLLPAIFLGTVLTHLCGGSAGREGAALQMGGTIGYHTGRLFRLDDRDLRTATMAGMAAFFAALFGTPLAATVFAIVVISVGVMYHAALIPCLTASLTAYGVACLMGVEPTRFTVEMPALEPWMLARAAVLAALCALVSVLFCGVIHFAEHQMRKRLPNPWVRVAVGGLAVIALTYLCGTTDYNGAGMEVITAAVEQGTARPEAFLLKLLFTAVTLAAGFKGGEVVPSFFVGATFGCVAGPLLGIPAGAAAALGLVAVFCGATNCPIASIFLAVELFGDGGLLYFALACGISYMLSGYNGLYSSQTILYSKLKAQYINVHTNAHHAGDPLREPPAAGRVKEGDSVS
nr:chloride channel protein [uncultured Dysosmobacter sp.]